MPKPTLEDFMPPDFQDWPESSKRKFMREVQKLELRAAERHQENIKAAQRRPLWTPNAGPQTHAFYCKADHLFYGGGAGGGKTDLLIGLALERHVHSQLFRREYTQLRGLTARAIAIVGSRNGFNGSNPPTFTVQHGVSRFIEFGAMKDAGPEPGTGSESVWQGRDADLKGFDEITHFTRGQYEFTTGWTRTAIPGQQTRNVAAGNPPQDEVNGAWVMDYWRPWIDTTYPYKADFGELCWFATLDGKDIHLEDGEPFFWTERGEEKLIVPKSRTFIPALVGDNPYYMATGYMATLQAMPEPIRSQMLYGDFNVGRKESDWQLIPFAWAQSAKLRHKAIGADRKEFRPMRPMTALGADIARGGTDRFILCPLFGNVVSTLIVRPGSEITDGQTAARLISQYLVAPATAHVDTLNVGYSVVDFLREYNKPCAAIGFGEKATYYDNIQGKEVYYTAQNGKMRFANMRTYGYWLLRELLDPLSGTDLALPDDAELMQEICAPRWFTKGDVICLEPKDSIKARIGRSPDTADALVLALLPTPPSKQLLYIPSFDAVSGGWNSSDPNNFYQTGEAIQEPYQTEADQRRAAMEQAGQKPEAYEHPDAAYFDDYGGDSDLFG